MILILRMFEIFVLDEFQYTQPNCALCKTQGNCALNKT
jgi:hypothetical protein